MSIIPSASPADIGYVRLGPSTYLPLQEARTVAKVAELRGFCHVWDTGSELWVRDRARERGHPRPTLLTQLASLDARTDLADSASLDFLRLFDARYQAHQARSVPPGPLYDPSELADPSVPASRRAEVLLLSLWRSEPNALPGMLRRETLPSFFSWVPEGRVLFFKTDYGFESRYGYIRGGYAMSVLHAADLTGSVGLPFLRKWHTVSTVETPRLVVDLAATLGFPDVYAFCSGPLGALVAFVGAPIARSSPPAKATTWESFFAQRRDFGHRGGVLSQPVRLPHGLSLTADDTAALIVWIAERYSALAFHATDVCEFKDATGDAEFVVAFEFSMTVDRIVRRGLAAATSEEFGARVDAAFEIADLIESLRCRWDSAAGKTKFFKELFDPVRGRARLQRALAAAPGPIRALIDVAYDDLRATTLGSVWTKARLVAGGVQVRSKDFSGDVIETVEEFTGNVMRAYRNAHHGYLSDGANAARRPSRYLALVDGTMSPAVSVLGTLWALAVVADPEEMLGWKWQPLGAFDPVPE